MKEMSRFSLLCALLMLLLAPLPAMANDVAVAAVTKTAASASNDCYGLREQQAEAAIRIHSELMVTALTCQYNASGQSLVDLYVAFGKRHAAYLRAAEQTIIGFHNARAGAGVATLDRLRTVLGNEYAERIAREDPMLYCPRMAETVTGAAFWNSMQFEQAIQRAAAAGGSSMEACVVQARNN